MNPLQRRVKFHIWRSKNRPPKSVTCCGPSWFTGSPRPKLPSKSGWAIYCDWLAGESSDQKMFIFELNWVKSARIMQKSTQWGVHSGPWPVMKHSIQCLWPVTAHSVEMVQPILADSSSWAQLLLQHTDWAAACARAWRPTLGSP
jgi:hypothetical protein